MSRPSSTGPGERRRPTARAAALIVAVAALVGATVAGTATPAAPQAERGSCRGSGPVAAREIAYAEAPGVDPSLLSLDLFRPTRPAGCGPAPIVVFIHGGGFVSGDKANSVADKVDLFTGEGWLFASVNYRLSASSSGDGPGPVRYPTHEQDVVEAIAWLRDHSAEVGGDPNRIFLVGHSSGAFIASLISTDTSLLAAAGLSTGNVRCTASLDTEYDVADQIAQGGSQELFYRNAFGDDPATWAAGSPITHTAPGEPRPRFLVFTRGAARRVLRAQDFTAALRAGGTPASVIDLSPISHQEVNRAVGRPGDAAVTPALMAFFRTCASGPSDASNASWTLAAHRDLLGRAPTDVERAATTSRLARAHREPPSRRS